MFSGGCRRNQEAKVRKVLSRHQSNGYADFNIRSADEVYEYLQSRGSAFPLVEGINDVPGIDLQSGYKQILAVDSERNLVNFSQYLEY